MTRLLLLLVLWIGATALLSRSAEAAESLDSCIGYIDSLPTTISTQGVWCLRTDLTTAISSGSAISVQTNNVTIDCNNFKLGGLAAGAGTSSYGIAATLRLNLTVRNCNIRGFQTGVFASGGSGHAFVDNMFDANTYAGVVVSAADGFVIRDNRFLNTGGSTIAGNLNAIEVSGNGATIAGNIITGVSIAASFTNSTAWGIYAYSCTRCVVADNQISDVLSNGTSYAYGIAASTYSVVARNFISGLVSPGSNEYGISCNGPTVAALGNVIGKTTNPLFLCTDGGGNVIVP